MLLQAMRPRQWTKNLFVFAGIVFSGRVLEADAELRTWSTFAAFCLMSSAAYLINDVHDRDVDRVNPRTANRPIARGDLSPRRAIALAIACAAVALAIAALVNWETLATLGAFALLQLAYSAFLKHVQFVDVMTISAGFVTRALAGPLCIDAELSPWLVLATGLLALFLALTKRRSEIVALGEDSPAQRRVLAHYSTGLLDELIAVVTPSIVMVYAIYCVLAAPTDLMLSTLPFVLYGIFRMLFLIHHRSETTEDPSVLAVRDRPLLACVVLWGVVAGAITVSSY